MDSGVCKMAATSMKIMNNQKGIFTPKMPHVNHGKFISTERLVNKPTNVALNEESVKVENKIIGAKRANAFKSIEQAEMMKVCVRQRKTIYRPSVDKWPDLMSSSKDYSKSSTLPPSGMESQNVTSLPSEVESERLPFSVRDVVHTFIPHSPERSSVLFRQDGKNCYSEVKNQASNHCSKIKSGRSNNQKKEMLLQDTEDIGYQDTSLRHGTPFNFSNKRVVLKSNVPHHIDASDRCKGIKISEDISTVRSVGRMCQKVLDRHQMSHRQTPTVPGTWTYSDNSSVTCKTATNGMQKDKLIISPSDGIKGGLVNFKEKDKTEGSCTHRRFLLIDSQGLPYTVVVEEPLSIGLSNSISTSWTDSTLAEVSKSLAPRKVYKCPVCFRIFEYLSYLQRHSIAHSQQKPHVCKVCGKAFKRTSHLTRHKYTHFGGKPCQCQICQRRFRDAGELTLHQQCHTEEKNH